MKPKIYVPKDFSLPEILGNIEHECETNGFELIKTTEKICIDHTLLNRSSLTLLSPLGYGLGVKKADFRIVPTLTAGLVGYTGKSSLYFNEGLSSIDKIGVNDPDDFLTIIGKIILSERYDIQTEFEKTSLVLPEILRKYSSVILNGNDKSFSSMDITEDWFETFEIPLIAGVWVIRNDEEPDNVIELTKKFAVDDLPEEIDVSMHYDENNSDALREGKIITRWNDEIHNAFEQTLELLFYHRLLPEIPAIKIYGVE